MYKYLIFLNIYIIEISNFFFKLIFFNLYLINIFIIIHNLLHIYVIHICKEEIELSVVFSFVQKSFICIEL